MRRCLSWRSWSSTTRRNRPSAILIGAPRANASLAAFLAKMLHDCRQACSNSRPSEGPPRAVDGTHEFPERC